MAAQAWTPHDSLTVAPTNLKEAIDWVLRVTGKDGKKNTATQSSQSSTSNGPHCLCYLAKAVKDLLYDAKDPGTPGPRPKRYWDDILLEQEKDIVMPVLTDLGLANSGSTSAASTTCAGGTEVIGALIDQLALGLQKWVGWQEGDGCCLKGDSSGKSTGIGKGCSCSGSNCCTPSGSPSCQCTTATSGTNTCCYKSAYQRPTTPPGSAGSTPELFLWTTISDKPDQVHLLARIFLGSVCLIWSGLSQLGFLTGDSRWKDSSLHEICGDSAGLGSFMAAVGYDLDRLNQGTGDKNGTFVNELLTKNDKGVPWKEFTKDSATKDSVADYYSSIYDKAKETKITNTESICKEYPLLVLHILASGYFRAGSAGAKNVTVAPKAPQPVTTSAKDTTTTKKEEAPSARKPRTIREILYWLSALPYSQGYCQLVERMQAKYPPKEGSPNETVDQIDLYNEGAASKNGSTTLKRDDITHYLMAACGYCPLVLIGIQGTIEKEVTQPQPQQASGPAEPAKKCEKHKKDPRSGRCKFEEKDTAAAAAPPAPATTGMLEKGEVCYGGYHLEVKDFGPLHGMYANGLFGFQMDISPAQCLDQLRVYVYHCFYQLYFLRKQCGTGVELGVGVAGKTVLGWQSCRYGSGLKGAGSTNWICKGSSKDKCNCHSSTQSPLMLFLCDSVTGLHCGRTTASSNNETNPYPEIKEHMEAKIPSYKADHFGGPPMHCPVPMGWQQDKENHFKDLNTGTHRTEKLSPPAGKYPAHCTGRTLSLLLEYYCDPDKCQSGTLVVLLRLLACITPTVPRTLGDLFGFYYYIVYIGGRVSWDYDSKGVKGSLKKTLDEVSLGEFGIYKTDGVIGALSKWKGEDGGSNSGAGCSHTNVKEGSLRTLFGCKDGTGQCCPYLSPLSGQQYGQLSPLMAGTYLSWLVYLIEGFQRGLEGLKKEFQGISCKDSDCKGQGGASGCGEHCRKGNHGETCTGSGSAGVCGCTSVVSCTGVLPVLYKYGFGYGNVGELHPGGGQYKKCHDFLTTLEGVLKGNHLKTDSKTGLHREINQLIYTTRLPWIFVLTVAWLVAVLYLAFGAIWPLDWSHMRSHCRGWFRKGSLSPWEILMVGKKKGRGILEFFGRK